MKKKIITYVLSAVALLIVVLAAVDISITEINAKKLPHRYASAQEGKELLLANEEYYSHFTQNDIDYRMGKSGATMDELLKASADEIRSFNLIEKIFIDHDISKMVRTLEKNGYVLPETDEIVFIKSDMSVEMGNSGYTHGTQIYLNSLNIFLGIIPGGSGEFFNEMLWHELFHCLTRCNPEFRAQMYSLIGFTITDSEFELPPCVQELFISNPDVEHHNSYATFIIDGKETDCFPVWITTKNYAEAISDPEAGKAVVLIPIDGTDIYYTREQASNFDSVFGTNTGYVIDPEECMADNFAYAMFYGIGGKNGQGYPDPEIIQGIIDYVSR